MNGQKKVGRPVSNRELAEVRHEVKFTPTEYEELKRKREETGVPIRTYIKRLVVHDLAAEPQVSQEPIPLFGYIPAGQAVEVRPLPPGATVTPPFEPCPVGMRCW